MIFESKQGERISDRANHSPIITLSSQAVSASSFVLFTLTVNFDGVQSKVSASEHLEKNTLPYLSESSSIIIIKSIPIILDSRFDHFSGQPDRKSDKN